MEIQYNMLVSLLIIKAIFETLKACEGEKSTE